VVGFNPGSLILESGMSARQLKPAVDLQSVNVAVILNTLHYTDMHINQFQHFLKTMHGQNRDTHVEIQKCKLNRQIKIQNRMSNQARLCTNITTSTYT